ncbi:Dermatan-sulfate epimerase [Orchesella cincta]|uniref:Dermatan-sulfate epimerase n=1 Tax=Orchesella cincta TaxID=48709 RepID=A0A1D2M2K7_ORCCI|nr:Dermatan-sulfate epimerase [Orchesella cincta]
MASGPTSTPTVGEKDGSSTPKPGAASGGKPEFKREKNANVNDKGDAKSKKEKFGGSHPFDDIPELPPVPEELLPKIIAFLMAMTSSSAAALKEVHDESRCSRLSQGKRRRSSVKLTRSCVRPKRETRKAKEKLRQIDEELRQAKSESHREKGKHYKLEVEMQQAKGEQRQTMGVLTKMQKQLCQCENELLQLKKPAKEDSKRTDTLLFGDMTGMIMGSGILVLGMILGSALAEKRK